MKLKRVIGYGLVVIVFGAAFYATSRSQDIIDWWKLRDYEPTPRIAEISNAVSFTEYGEKLFYVHNPTILSDKAAFAEACRTSKEIIVLGCHITNQEIFIYDVDDERLDGIVEVTAAHEMLHAAWDRLSPAEQDDLTKLLEAEYDEIKVTNDRLRETINSYAERDPGVVPNELHSILGTELRELSKPLEEHYAQYFEDRLQVVALSEAYEEEFIAREEKIASFDAQLNALNGDITRLQADISLQSQALQTERELLESLRNIPEQFNAGIPAYNAKVNSYNRDVERLRILIEEYNVIVAQRNEIALEERELVEAIDSRVETL